ncbi:hypothetical protein M434DRAFT_206123 [Hypoxylon sp. CO27-5]|nr:hypothetical protein M434DRAFT_206123 [Hypoxylon sp. CO27-5]
MWLMYTMCFVCPRHWWSGISMRGVWVETIGGSIEFLRKQHGKDEVPFRGPCVAQGLPLVPPLIARCTPILYPFDARRLGATDESPSSVLQMSDSGEAACGVEDAGETTLEDAGLLHQGYPENPGSWNRDMIENDGYFVLVVSRV